MLIMSPSAPVDPHTLLHNSPHTMTQPPTVRKAWTGYRTELAWAYVKQTFKTERHLPLNSPDADSILRAVMAIFIYRPSLQTSRGSARQDITTGTDLAGMVQISPRRNENSFGCSPEAVATLRIDRHYVIQCITSTFLCRSTMAIEEGDMTWRYTTSSNMKGKLTYGT